MCSKKSDMDKAAVEPEISIIVPVYNEAGIVEELFRTLAEQVEVALELIICDGGSADTTVTKIWALAEDAPFPVSVIHCGKGRGRQLNAGAAASSGKTLLFLHADSAFTDSHALRSGLDTLDAAVAKNGNDRLAGHFALRFVRRCDSRPRGYYHYECKARLHRRECTHGDQGLLLRQSFFNEAGPFDETLPILEDTRMAESIRQKGLWLLLPAEIHTSARRFETEGLAERQTLNAIILNFAAIGREDFLLEIPDIYSCQNNYGHLQLAPFFRRFRQQISALSWTNRLRLWYATGTYVRSNAWQLALALDTLRNFRQGIQPGEGNTACLEFYDRYIDRLTDHAPGKLATALLVRLWFQFTWLTSSFRDRYPTQKQAKHAPRLSANR